MVGHRFGCEARETASMPSRTNERTPLSDLRRAIVLDDERDRHVLDVPRAEPRAPGQVLRAHHRSTAQQEIKRLSNRAGGKEKTQKNSRTP
jgi:hypothetical protein